MTPMWGSPVVLGGLGALRGNKLGYIRLGPSEKNNTLVELGFSGVFVWARSCCVIKDTGTPSSLPWQDTGPFFGKDWAT